MTVDEVFEMHLATKMSFSAVRLFHLRTTRSVKNYLGARRCGYDDPKC